MICAWIDTSSAVVGSSATISRGSAPAPARSPRAGACRRRTGAGTGRCAARPPGCRSPAAGRPRARAPRPALTGRWVRMVSTSCRPTVYSGFSEVSGSWKMAPIACRGSGASARQVVDALAAEQDLAAGDAPRRLEQADDGRAGERLAGARFADHAQDLARRDVERDVVQRQQRAAPRGELDAQVAHFSRGAVGGMVSAASGSARRAASRPAGSRSAIIISITPGKMVIHHSPENRKSLPMRISVPSEGEVGGTPTPRNDSVASVMIAAATWIVASTSTGPSTLGSTWRNMMRSGATPITRAACTYSLLRSTSVEPRTVRAYCTQPVSEMATISTPKASVSCASGNIARPRRRSAAPPGSPGTTASRRTRA
jgi:hypothetical protein